MTRKERRWKKSKGNPSNFLINFWDNHIVSLANKYIRIKSKHVLRRLKKGYLRVKESHDKGDVINIKIRKDRGMDSPSSI